MYIQTHSAVLMIFVMYHHFPTTVITSRHAASQNIPRERNNRE